MSNKERIAEKIMPLSFYKAGGVHTGSLDSMRYVIKKETSDGAESLFVCAWPGPFAFDATGDDLKKSEKFTVTNEGLEEASAWLADIYESSETDFSAPVSLLESDDRLKDH